MLAVGDLRPGPPTALVAVCLASLVAWTALRWAATDGPIPGARIGPRSVPWLRSTKRRSSRSVPRSALGEALLGRFGQRNEAAHLAAVFEMAEGRLAS